MSLVNETSSVIMETNKLGKKGLQAIKSDLLVYILMLPAIIITFIFSYLPMPGIITAFQDYNIFLGPFRSPWVGIKHIAAIFQMPLLSSAVLNTLKLSLLTLVFTFPAPIILALMLNEVRNHIYKRIVQTISYLPYFLSWISVIGIAYSVYSVYGNINDIRVLLFGENTERIMFLGIQGLFVPNIIILTLWKTVGWNSIIYLAAISGIDQQLYEAAFMDGAGRFQQMCYITLPGILPTTMILLIFNLGYLFSSNFELVYGLQNPFIDFEVISTVVFKNGIQQANYSMAAAVGFMEGLMAFLLTASANKLSKIISGISIW